MTDGTEILASGADFHIYNLNKEGTATALDAANDFTILKSTGAVCDATDADVGFVKLSLTTPEVVPAGSTYAYAVYFNSDSASAVNDDSVQMGIAADPIASSLIALGTARTVSGAHTALVTTLTGSGVLDTTAGSAVKVGDILAFAGTERVLVTAYGGGISRNHSSWIHGYNTSSTLWWEAILASQVHCSGRTTVQRSIDLIAELLRCTPRQGSSNHWQQPLVLTNSGSSNVLGDGYNTDAPAFAGAFGLLVLMVSFIIPGI